jgi:segregation and condensation protein B
MELDKEKGLVEAILFLESEPIDAASISRISGLSKDVVLHLVGELKEAYSSPEHGIELIEIGDGFHFAPKKDLWHQLQGRYGKQADKRLSKAAIETLSIIAYSQPITRSEIENIRGVSPDGMIRLLLERNLIREVGKKDIPGKPVQYGTTKEFLKMFRLGSISDLPKLDEIEQERFELNG